MNNKKIAVLTSLGLGIYLIANFQEEPMALNISKNESVMEIKIECNKKKDLNNYKVFRKSSNNKNYSEVKYNKEKGIYTDSLTDIKNPEIKINKVQINTMYDSLSLDVKSNDVNDTITYYTEAKDKSGKVYTSKKKKVQYSSGIKGYSYTIDEKKESNIPNTVNLSSTNTNIPLSQEELKSFKEKDMYLHIKAIDNKGNVSETKHYSLKSLKEVNTLTSPVLRIDSTDERDPEYNTVNLSWAVDIPKQNILWSLGFEAEEQRLININVFNSGPRQRFVEDAYSGRYSIWTPKSTEGQGEVPEPDGSPSNKNMIDYNGKRIPLPNGSKISASFRLKSSDPVTVNLFSDWSYFNELKSYNSFYAEDYPAGTTRIKVTGDPLTVGYSLTTDPRGDVHELNNQIIRENHDGSYELFRPLNYSVRRGEPVKYREHGYAFSLPEMTTHSSELWELYNINGEVSNPSGFDWNQNPVNLKQYWSAQSPAQMDDLKVGYTTKVKLYRNEELIYEGYNGKFRDRALDEQKPNIVDRIDYNTKKVGDDTQFLIQPKGVDAGTVYTYKAIGEDIDGSLSPKSNSIEYTSTSGIKGYSYVIDTNPSTQVDETMDLPEGRKIDITLPSNQDTHYLHIRAIDKMNNVGDVNHIKIETPKLNQTNTDFSNEVNLNWDLGNLQGDYTYKVFRKKEGDSNYTEIVSINDNLKEFSYVDRVDTSSIIALPPTITNSKIVDSGSNVEFDITRPENNTTRYTYYIEAYDKTTRNSLVSNTVDIEIKSKTVGYSYILDELSSTTPDSRIDCDSSNSKIKVPYFNSKGNKILHIVAIDNFNNVSETVHYTVKNINPPEITLTASTTNPTKDNVVINVTTRAEAGVDYIITPNGQKIHQDSTSYSVDKNGRYSFLIVDMFGNRASSQIEINNIDKNKPTLTINKDSNQEWVNTDVNITINGEDR